MIGAPARRGPHRHGTGIQIPLVGHTELRLSHNILLPGLWYRAGAFPDQCPTLSVQPFSAVSGHNSVGLSGHKPEGNSRKTLELLVVFSRSLSSI